MFRVHLVVGQVAFYMRVREIRLCVLRQLIPKYFYLGQLKFWLSHQYIHLDNHFLELAIQVLLLQRMHQINPFGFRDRLYKTLVQLSHQLQQERDRVHRQQLPNECDLNAAGQLDSR